MDHLLAQVPDKPAPREKVKLPKSQKPGDYDDPNYPMKLIAEKY